MRLSCSNPPSPPHSHLLHMSIMVNFCIMTIEEGMVHTPQACFGDVLQKVLLMRHTHQTVPEMCLRRLAIMIFTQMKTLTPTNLLSRPSKRMSYFDTNVPIPLITHSELIIIMHAKQIESSIRSCEHTSPMYSSAFKPSQCH